MWQSRLDFLTRGNPTLLLSELHMFGLQTGIGDSVVVSGAIVPVVVVAGESSPGRKYNLWLDGEVDFKSNLSTTFSMKITIWSILHQSISKYWSEVRVYTYDSTVAHKLTFARPSRCWSDAKELVLRNIPGFGSPRTKTTIFEQFHEKSKWIVVRFHAHTIELTSPCLITGGFEATAIENVFRMMISCQQSIRTSHSPWIQMVVRRKMKLATNRIADYWGTTEIDFNL